MSLVFARGSPRASPLFQGQVERRPHRKQKDKWKIPLCPLRGQHSTLICDPQLVTIAFFQSLEKNKQTRQLTSAVPQLVILWRRRLRENGNGRVVPRLWCGVCFGWSMSTDGQILLLSWPGSDTLPSCIGWGGHQQGTLQKTWHDARPFLWRSFSLWALFYEDSYLYMGTRCVKCSLLCLCSQRITFLISIYNYLPQAARPDFLSISLINLSLIIMFQIPQQYTQNLQIMPPAYVIPITCLLRRWVSFVFFFKWPSDNYLGFKVFP